MSGACLSYPVNVLWCIILVFPINSSSIGEHAALGLTGVKLYTAIIVGRRWY